MMCPKTTRAVRAPAVPLTETLRDKTVFNEASGWPDPSIEHSIRRDWGHRWRIW